MRKINHVLINVWSATLSFVTKWPLVRHTVDYNHLIIQLGECWSGEEAGETYNRAGTSDKCVTKDYVKCNPSDNEECVGEQNVNFVYGIDVKGNYSSIPCFLFTRFCLRFTLVLILVQAHLQIFCELATFNNSCDSFLTCLLWSLALNIIQSENDILENHLVLSMWYWIKKRSNVLSWLNTNTVAFYSITGTYKMINKSFGKVHGVCPKGVPNCLQLLLFG